MIRQQIAGAVRACGLPPSMPVSPCGGAPAGRAVGEDVAARRIALPAQASSAPAARRHLMRALRAWRLEALADSAQLVTSELVTNAVKASRDGLDPHPGDAPRTIAVTFARAADGVRVEVWDENTTPPAMRGQDLMDEGGRGLFLVDVLARDWGYRAAERGGKIVWCEIAP